MIISLDKLLGKNHLQKLWSDAEIGFHLWIMNESHKTAFLEFESYKLFLTYIIIPFPLSKSCSLCSLRAMRCLRWGEVTRLKGGDTT